MPDTPPYPIDDRGYCDVKGAASYRSQSVAKLNQDRHRGLGAEFVRFGRSVRYSYAALDADASQHRRTCTRDAAEAA